MRLRLKGPFSGATAKDRFNSIKVRLRHADRLLPCPPTSFQFHKGAIKTPYVAGWPVRDVCFNSIKVRLRHTNKDSKNEYDNVSIP